MEFSDAEPTRRRSAFRWLVTAAAAAAALAIGGVIFGHQGGTTSTRPGPALPWFAGYADVTATPAFAFESPATAAGRNVVLSFIVSARDAPCTPSWGATFTMEEASRSLDLDRRVAGLQQRGGGISVAFGGQRNVELAAGCTDIAKLAAAYAMVIDRYHLATIDLDLEGVALRDRAVMRRRALAIKKLQADRRASGKPLEIWLTLPVSPKGLTRQGEDTVDEMLGRGVDLAGVNAMTMNYSSSRADGQSMLEATTAALTATQRQLKLAYRRANIDLSSATAWSKLGATPMIGQNDVLGEVFGLEAAKGLNEFVLGRGIGRVSMWSLNRDATCSPDQVDAKRLSGVCSGVRQGDQRFADVLGSGLAGQPGRPKAG